MDPNPEEWNHWVYKEVHNNKRHTKHIIPWLLLSVIAKLKVKDNAGLDLDAGPNSDFSKFELGPLASKVPQGKKLCRDNRKSPKTSSYQEGSKHVHF